MIIPKLKAVLLASVLGLSSLTLYGDAMQPQDCSAMSQEMQQFAGQLTPINREMFGGKVTDGQRASAMQMASKPDATGMTMTPDMAVQKVAGASGATPQQKTPTGCPVK